MGTTWSNFGYFLLLVSIFIVGSGMPLWGWVVRLWVVRLRVHVACMYMHVHVTCVLLALGKPISGECGFHLAVC